MLQENINNEDDIKIISNDKDPKILKEIFDISNHAFELYENNNKINLPNEKQIKSDSLLYNQYIFDIISYNEFFFNHNFFRIIDEQKNDKNNLNEKEIKQALNYYLQEATYINKYNSIDKIIYNKKIKQKFINFFKKNINKNTLKNISRIEDEKYNFLTLLSFYIQTINHKIGKEINIENILGFDYEILYYYYFIEYISEDIITINENIDNFDKLIIPSNNLIYKKLLETKKKLKNNIPSNFLHYYILYNFDINIIKDKKTSNYIKNTLKEKFNGQNTKINKKFLKNNLIYILFNLYEYIDELENNNNTEEITKSLSEDELNTYYHYILIKYY